MPYLPPIFLLSFSYLLPASFRFLSRYHSDTISLPVHYYPIPSPCLATCQVLGYFPPSIPVSTPYALRSTLLSFHFSPQKFAYPQILLYLCNRYPTNQPNLTNRTNLTNNTNSSNQAVMKKILSLILTLVATTTLWAYDFRSGDLYYNITSDTTVKVTYQYDWSSNNYAGLTTVTIPETVTYNDISYSVTGIGDLAFLRCSSLTSVIIPNSVTSIENSAFSGCISLTSVTIPNSVTSIGDEAFFDCYSLTSITIPSSVTSIGEIVFGTSIEEDIFVNYPFLATISIEDGNPIYDSRENCNAIIETATNTLIAGCQNTIIPNSVTSIGTYAFYGCFILSSISIPNGVTSIKDYAFAGCFNLSSITIPNSITSIGEGAFSGGFTIITIICEAIKVPTLESYVFSDRDISEAILYVPAESLEDYKVAEQWKEFGTILPIEELPAAVENTHIPSSTVNTCKLLRDGQLLIIRDGKTYTVMGTEVK